jgi:CubicO group peptidase (beta-lactamase class C family)
MVSAAAIAAMEAGRLGLDDPVTRFLPGFRPRLPDGTAPDIRIRHLLTHTAGLTYDLAAAGPAAARGSGGLDGARLSMAENMRRIAGLPLLFAPGSGWSYSLALDVIGAVLEAAEGRGLPEIVRTRVTDPLGMADTGFTVRAPDRLSVPYADGRPPHPMADTEGVATPDGGAITFAPGRAFDPAVFPSGGAGMVGSAEDFLLFLETLRKGGAPLVSPGGLALLAENAIGALSAGVPGRGFSHGWSILTDPQAHGAPASPGSWAWGGVYGHQWLVDPVQRLTVVSFTNTAVEGCMGAFPDDIFRAVYNVT